MQRDPYGSVTVQRRTPTQQDVDVVVPEFLRNQRHPALFATVADVETDVLTRPELYPLETQVPPEVVTPSGQYTLGNVAILSDVKWQQDPQTYNRLRNLVLTPTSYYKLNGQMLEILPVRDPRPCPLNGLSMEIRFGGFNARSLYCESDVNVVDAIIAVSDSRAANVSGPGFFANAPDSRVANVSGGFANGKNPQSQLLKQFHQVTTSVGFLPWQSAWASYCRVPEEAKKYVQHAFIDLALKLLATKELLIFTNSMVTEFHNAVNGPLPRESQGFTLPTCFSDFKFTDDTAKNLQLAVDLAQALRVSVANLEADYKFQVQKMVGELKGSSGTLNCKGWIRNTTDTFCLRGEPNFKATEFLDMLFFLLCPGADDVTTQKSARILRSSQLLDILNISAHDTAQWNCSQLSVKYQTFRRSITTQASFAELDNLYQEKYATLEKHDKLLDAKMPIATAWQELIANVPSRAQSELGLVVVGLLWLKALDVNAPQSRLEQYARQSFGVV